MTLDDAVKILAVESALFGPFLLILLLLSEFLSLPADSISCEFLLPVKSLVVTIFECIDCCLLLFSHTQDGFGMSRLHGLGFGIVLLLVSVSE